MVARVTNLARGGGLGTIPGVTGHDRAHGEGWEVPGGRGPSLYTLLMRYGRTICVYCSLGVKAWRRWPVPPNPHGHARLASSGVLGVERDSSGFVLMVRTTPHRYPRFAEGLAESGGRVGSLGPDKDKRHP